MRISDWSSGVCSSDLRKALAHLCGADQHGILVERAGGNGMAGERVERIMLEQHDHPARRQCGAQLRQQGYMRGFGYVMKDAGNENENEQDRKSVVEGKSVSVRVELGGRRSIKKKKNKERK